MRLMRWALVIALVSPGIRILRMNAAQASPPYMKLFDQKYMQPESMLWQANGGKSKCNFCHTEGTRSGRNDYGKALGKLLRREDSEALFSKARKEDPERYKMTEKKVVRALESIEELPSNPRLKDAPSFGDLIRSGRLPVTP